MKERENESAKFAYANQSLFHSLQSLFHSFTNRSFAMKLTPYLLVSPYLLHFAVFVAFPVVFSVILTFHDWNIIAPMQYVGGANYARLVQDRLFWQAIGNTLRFLVMHIPLQIGVALLLAELLNRTVRGAAFFQIGRAHV